jgi:hypothetical protein
VRGGTRELETLRDAVDGLEADVEIDDVNQMKGMQEATVRQRG